MKKEVYDKLARPFETDEKKKNRLIRLNNIITKAVYIVYPAMLVALAAQRDIRFFRVLLVPLITFLVVTIFRKIRNAPRPYEVWNSPPLIPKDTKGNSFPSRHVFSVYIIAMAALYVCKPLGIVLMIVGVFLAVARVIARVHFLKDVVAGAIIGIVLGCVGFFLI